MEKVRGAPRRHEKVSNKCGKSKESPSEKQKKDQQVWKVRKAWKHAIKCAKSAKVDENLAKKVSKPIASRE